MLFDHGCDALGLIFLALSVVRIICIDSQQTILYIGFVGAIFGFYFSVWCQYYSKGIMILGQVNAVDDGIPAVWIMSIFTFIVGQQFWTKSFGQFGDVKITPRLCFQYGMLFSTILQIWSLLNNSKNNFTKDYIGAIKDLSHVILIILSLVCIIQFSHFQKSHFYAVFFTLCLMFTRNIIYMQLCVTAEMVYNQFQLSTILFIVGYPFYIFVLSEVGISQNLFIYSLLIFTALDFIYFTLKAIFQLRKILNIRVFRVSKQKR